MSLTFSCNSTKDTVSTKNLKEVENNDIKGNKKHINATNVDLTLLNQLRKISGVCVQGSGSDASIYIRGKSSINMSSKPLFFVNDQIVDGGYAAIVNLIDPRDIKYIEVLKTANEISFYGSRGASGVIKITTK